MRSAVAFPMPRLDPVTTATLPSSRMHRSATRRGGRHAQALQDEPDLLTLVSRQVAARAGEPDEPLRAEALAHVLAQPLEQAHVAAAVLERDEVGDLAGEPLQQGGRERDAVARVDRDAERRGFRDLTVVADEALGV